MNPDYLWLTGALQLLTFFVIAPALALAVPYRAWRSKSQNVNPARYPMLSVAFGITALLLFGFAKWLNADVRSAQYFLQSACVLVSGLSFGLCAGYGFSILVGSWRWHKRTRP